MNADGLSRIAMSSGLAASLSRATDYARAQGDGEVTLEHMLLALCDDPDAVLVLAASNVNVAELSAEMGRQLSVLPVQPHGQGGELAVADDLRRILEAAAAAARGGRRREINGAIVLAAIVGDGKSAAAHVLSALGLTFEGAIRALQSKPAQQTDASGRPLPPTDAEAILADARERVQSRTGGRPALRAPVREEEPPEEKPEYVPEERRFEALPAPEPILPEPEPMPFDAALAAPTPMRAPQHQHAPAHFEPEAPHEPAFEPTHPGELNPQYDEYASPGYEPADYGQPEFESGPYEPQPHGEHGYDAGPPPMPASAPYPPPIPAPNPHEGWAPPPGPGPSGSRLGPPPAPPRPSAPPMPPAASRPGPPPLAPWPEPEQQMGAGARPGMPAGYELNRQMPPQAAPRQGARRAASARAEVGQLVENIPRSMRVAVRVLVEVRVARADVEALAQGLQGGGAAYQHEVMVTKAMSVRLVAPEGGFYIEMASPETQWIERATLLSQDDFASWRWHVTPREKGRKRLQLIISARTVSAEGLAAETALPDQVITVRVRTNYAQAASRWIGWGIAAVAGGLLAKFGEGAFAIISRMLHG